MSRIDDRLVRLTARFLGTALAVAACDPAAAFHHSALATAMVVLVALVAWWAAPMVDERPVQTSVRWGALARRRRTTVLAAGSVVLAAWTQPPVWLAACVTVLLLAYLLATDTWTAGVTATPDVRVTGAPALAAAAACALVFLASCAPLAHTSWARLPAALAVVATATCLVLALRHRGTEQPQD